MAARSPSARITVFYAGIGDGGSGGDPDGNGQNLGTLLGKIIRISSTDGTPCAAAPGNPFVGVGGARGEIWALGVRNPWRITFDRMTGDLFIADVGQDSREEVDFQAPGVAGRNYCWRRKEGTIVYDAGTPCTTGTPTDPVLEYDHSSGKCSITGGYRYRGSALPTFAGVYFYADYCTGMIWGATESGGMWSAMLLLSTGFNISTFGEDERGEIYFARYGASGAIYRLAANLAARVNGPDFNADGISDILWRNSDGSVAEWLMNGGSFTGASVASQVDNNWHIVGTGDFDGDGKSDILWRASEGSVAMWLMNGASINGVSVVSQFPNDWQIAGVGDFNGDGKSDILLRYVDGSVAMWLMNGGTIVAGVGIAGQVSGAWQIVGIGDFNGDGKSDVLWRATDGSVGLWQMNGGSFTGVSVANGVSAAWSTYQFPIVSASGP